MMKKFKINKQHKKSAIIAIIAVIIMAIPSKNNSYTECGVGSVYTTHYYEGESYGKCEMTIGGAMKLTGAFVAFFYLSLLVLDRREREDKIETKLDKKITKTKQTREEKGITTKLDESFDNFSDNEDDYKNIPF